LLSKPLKKSVLQSILNSDEFSGSRNSQKLLTYLINASITGKSPTETTIALELFGRDKNFNPNEDPIIRVYVHNLRKKLENYYRNEGLYEKIRIEIPKGHYEARFVPVSQKLNIIPPKKYNAGILILCLIACIQFFLFIGLRKEKKELIDIKRIQQNREFSHLFWTDSLKNDLPFLIIFGDDFFFQKYQTTLQKWLIVRDNSINYINDFDQYQIQNPNLKLKLFEYSFFPSTYIIELIHLSDIIHSISEKNIRYLCASELKPYDIEGQNIVFFGNVNTLGCMNRFFSSPYFTIEEFNQTFSLPSITEDTLKTYTALSESNGKNRDYAIIKKIKSPHKNNILIITSFHQSGLINAVKFLRNPITTKVLENSFIEKFNKIPSDFAILLEVTGEERKGWSVEIQEIYEISPSFNFSN